MLSCLFTIVYFSQGQDKRHQLDMTTNLCGSITPEVWPGVEKLQNFQDFIVNDKNQKNRLLIKNKYIYLFLKNFYVIKIIL